MNNLQNHFGIAIRQDKAAHSTCHNKSIFSSKRFRYNLVLKCINWYFLAKFYSEPYIQFTKLAGLFLLVYITFRVNFIRECDLHIALTSSINNCRTNFCTIHSLFVSKFCIQEQKPDSHLYFFTYDSKRFSGSDSLVQYPWVTS